MVLRIIQFSFGNQKLCFRSLFHIQLSIHTFYCLLAFFQKNVCFIFFQNINHKCFMIKNQNFFGKEKSVKEREREREKINQSIDLVWFPWILLLVNDDEKEKCCFFQLPETTTFFSSCNLRTNIFQMIMTMNNFSTSNQCLCLFVSAREKN